LVAVYQWRIYDKVCVAEGHVPAFDASFDGVSPAAGGGVPAGVRYAEAAVKRVSAKDLTEVLRRTARGERAAFERLYATTAAKLFGIVIRIVGRREVAEAVLQDVYVHLWRNAGDFNPRCHAPVAWMAAIARGRALDAVAGKTSGRTTHDRPEVQDFPAGEGPNEEERRLCVCLDRLEPEKRRALLRAYCYGMARDEIAEETDRPVATVKVWLRQSLAQLKDYLSQ
jgi:RNA polymerase sigma-70 factor (ECF subfamily)